MARRLNFEIAGQQHSVAIQKLDRDKLYGKVETHYYDREGQECYFGSVSEDGTMIFGREAFQTGYTNELGDWLERSQLQVVNLEGEMLEKKESSFNHALTLDTTVSIDDYLSYVSTSVYQLDASPELLAAVEKEENIYSFPFSYTAGYNENQAFLVANEGVLFMVVGQQCGFEFLGQEHVESPYIDSQDDDDDEEDDIDFSMF